MSNAVLLAQTASAELERVQTVLSEVKTDDETMNSKVQEALNIVINARNILASAG